MTTYDHIYTGTQPALIMSVISFGRRADLQIRRFEELDFLAAEPSEYLAVVRIWADTGEIIKQYTAPTLREQREQGITHMVEMAMHPSPQPEIAGPASVGYALTSAAVAP